MKTLRTPPLDVLADLVVKQHVALGGLAPARRALVLAFVWAGLPADRVLTERDVNEALRAQLCDAAAFLGTDHVELRRWLVDAGWLTRDGYGREYRRVAIAQLAAPLQPVARALEGLDAPTFAQVQRAARDAGKQARRAAWLARQADPQRESPLAPRT